MGPDLSPSGHSCWDSRWLTFHLQLTLKFQLFSTSQEFFLLRGQKADVWNWKVLSPDFSPAREGLNKLWDFVRIGLFSCSGVVFHQDPPSHSSIVNAWPGTLRFWNCSNYSDLVWNLGCFSCSPPSLQEPGKGVGPYNSSSSTWRSFVQFGEYYPDFVTAEKVDLQV